VLAEREVIRQVHGRAEPVVDVDQGVLLRGESGATDTKTGMFRCLSLASTHAFLDVLLGYLGCLTFCTRVHHEVSHSSPRGSGSSVSLAEPAKKKCVPWQASSLPG